MKKHEKKIGKLVFHTKEDWKQLNKAARMLGLSLPRREFIPEAYVNSRKSYGTINKNRFINMMSLEEKVQLFLELSKALGIEVTADQKDNIQFSGTELFELSRETLVDHILFQKVNCEGSIKEVEDIPQEEMS